MRYRYPCNTSLEHDRRSSSEKVIVVHEQFSKSVTKEGSGENAKEIYTPKVTQSALLEDLFDRLHRIATQNQVVERFWSESEHGEAEDRQVASRCESQLAHSSRYANAVRPRGTQAV